MLKTLIRRELLDNLMTFRFAAVLLITLLLVVANTVVLTFKITNNVWRVTMMPSKCIINNYGKAKTYSTDVSVR